MITLYTFGPLAGLPDASPFIMKAMTLLKLAGLDYRENREGLLRAPKGKLPYLDDDGTVVADSTFIRWHLEKTRGIDFDAHLTPEQRAIGWAVEKMCEEHLYWLILRTRWLDETNFQRGPARFFDRFPALVRPFITLMVRRKIARSIYLQGLGRHSEGEATELGRKDIETLATLLGDKPFLFGDAPCGADATVFGSVSVLLWPGCESSLRDAAEAHANLVAYRDRLMRSYFPSFVE
jgi:glutathione S-transferase